jgi:hypothetical protein
VRRFATWILVAGALASSLVFVLPTAVASAGVYYMQAGPYYGNSMPSFAFQSDGNFAATNPPGGIQTATNIVQGHYAHWIAYSPPGITITAAYTPPLSVLKDCVGDGFAGQYFWAGGGLTIGEAGSCTNGESRGTLINQAVGPSNYFGWGTTCSTLSVCPSTSGSVLDVSGVQLQLTENTPPAVTATGATNLWYQAAIPGHWVRGGSWPVGFTASDPSGVCATNLLINGQGNPWGLDATLSGRSTASFVQCSGGTANAILDTDNLPNGQITTIGYTAYNAAGVPGTPSEQIRVDNTQPGLTLATPNDADPNVWVNHPVRVVGTATAGASGIAYTGCKTNGAAGYVLPAGGATVNGTGIWTVECQSVNNAYNVGGIPNTSGPATVTVHIDETPPAVAFAPVDPADPQAVVANTSDGQSGVAGGQIQMRPASGGAWQSLGTAFDGRHLLARFNDVALSPGPWQIQATSCDHAGNCASADETLNLPVRTASVSRAGFLVRDPPKRTARRCVERKVRIGRGDSRHRRWRRVRVCARPPLVLKSRDRVSFGGRAVVHGFLTTATGAPIAGVPVTVYTAPQNGLYHYTPAASAKTSSAGTWWVRLSPGPSRLIDAVYAGSPTIQPSQSWGHLRVPARVRVLRVWPRRLAWGSTVRITARLLGGYLPPGGALVRLRIGYGTTKVTYGVKVHVAGTGIFRVPYTFGPGPSGLVLRYWFQECSLPTGNYPFGPGCGPRNFVTVGGYVPPTAPSPAVHHRRAVRHHRRPSRKARHYGKERTR